MELGIGPIKKHNSLLVIDMDSTWYRWVTYGTR